MQRNLQAAEAYQFDPDQIDELEELEDANMFKEPVTVEGETEPAPAIDSATFITAFNDMTAAGIPADTAVAVLTGDAR